MANVKVIEKNPGPKIEYEQDGTRLYFGDDEIMVNCSKYQKDWEQTVDICMDRVGNLTIGTRSALRYVAQIEIPAKEYTEEEVDEFLKILEEARKLCLEEITAFNPAY